MQAQPPAQPRRRRNRNRGNRGNSEMNILTGGTRDVKPQLLSATVSQTSADQGNGIPVVATIPMPVLRNFSGAGANRAQLVEVLKVWFHLPNTSEVDSNLLMVLGTKNLGTAAIPLVSDPSIIAASCRLVKITTSGQYITDTVTCVDLTDGDGNGVLVATDNLFFSLTSSTTGLTNVATVKVLYRIAGASVIEYVGIVQGQQ